MASKSKRQTKLFAGITFLLLAQMGAFAQFQNMKPVDINNDGRADLIDVYNNNGNAEIRVRISTPNGFVTEDWTGGGQGAYTESMNWFTGDFDTDGDTDIGKMWKNGSNMEADVHVSSGSGFTKEDWATSQGGMSYNQHWFAGDYTGDGTDDLLKLWNDGGTITIDVHESNTNSFTNVRKVTNVGGYFATMDFLSGDFNGDGALDIMKVWPDSGSYSLEAYEGGSFAVDSYAVQQGTYDLLHKWFIGDFNGDGKDDLVRLWGENFDIDQGGTTSAEAHISDGDTFTLQNWGTNMGDYGRDADYRHFAVGDFDGDGDDDIAQLWNDGGKLSVDLYRSNGSGFTRVNLMTQNSDWFRKKRWMVADYTGDGRTDICAVWDNNGTTTFEMFQSLGNALSYQIWAEETESGYYDSRWFGGQVESANGTANKICVSIPGSEANNVQGYMNDGIDIYLERNATYTVNGGANTNQAAHQWVYAVDGQRIETDDVIRIEDFATVIAGSQYSARVIKAGGRNYSVLRNVEVDGNRYDPNWDWSNGSLMYDKTIYLESTMEFGRGSYQLVDRVVAHSTRAWSTLTVNEGNSATWNIVQNVIINGAGPGPRGSGGADGENPNFNWAGKAAAWGDGISCAARNSLIRNNLVIDATDVGIVLFGAPGSLVEDNYVASVTRECLAAINMVDGIPMFDMGSWHDYRGVVVRDNVVDSWGSRVMNGVCMGKGRWGCGYTGDFRGATVVDNHFTGDCFGWGISYGQFTDTVIDRNTSDAVHSGSPDTCGPSSADFCEADTSIDFSWASIDSWNLPNGQYYGRSAMDTPDGSKYCFSYHGTGTDGDADQTITLSQNTEYRLSAWLKLLSGTDGIAYVDDNNKFNDTADPDVQLRVEAGDNEWTYQEVTFNSGSETAMDLRIFGHSSFANGALYVDQLSLVKVSDPNNNLVANGDFELGGGSSLQSSFEETPSGDSLDKLLWMRGGSAGSDGYFDYDYTTAEKRAIVRAAFVEILGRIPSETAIDNQIGYFADGSKNGDQFRTVLMQSTEFTTANPGVAPEDLQLFRQARWAERFIEIDRYHLHEGGEFSSAEDFFVTTTDLLATPAVNLPSPDPITVPPVGDTVVPPGGNYTPIVTSTPDTEIVASNLYSYTVTATDVEGDTITYSEVDIPSWLTFNAGSQLLSGTPDEGDVGTNNVTLRVADATGTNDHSFSIWVISTFNQPPVITSDPEVNITGNIPYSYQLTATDLEGDPLTYSASSLPAGLSFDPGTQILSGMAADGIHPISLSVHDGFTNTVQTFALSIGVGYIDRTDDNGVITPEDTLVPGSVGNGGSPAGEQVTMLVDNDPNTKFLTFNASSWVQYQFENSNQYAIKKYTITSANDNDQRDPLNWTLEGSTDGSNWTVVDTQSGVNFPARNTLEEFDCSDNDTAYSYYRLDMVNNSGDILQLSEIELFGEALTTVPSVVGQSQSSAETDTIAAGLSVGTVTTENSDTVAAGDVISQDPVAAAQVAPGAAVDLVVSIGSALTGYEAWAATEGVTSSNTVNLLEYALDGDTTSYGDSAPTMTKEGGEFKYIHNQRSDDPNLVYTVETSADLTANDWAPAGMTAVTNVTGAEYNVVTNTIPTTASQSYIRLKVENQ